MAQWIVNDLSLQGQFETVESFWVCLEHLLRIRETYSAAKANVHCSKGFAFLRAARDAIVREAIFAQGEDKRVLALRWITKGPFWDAARRAEVPQIFYFKNTDVTDQGLGEISRRRMANVDARSLSFPGLTTFEVPELAIQQLNEDETTEHVQVPNVWGPASLDYPEVWGEEAPSGWQRLIDDLVERNGLLLIARDEILGQLRPYPYDSAVADRVAQLLGVLQEIARNLNEYGRGSSELNALLQVYFVPREAQFSDESVKNKKVFKKEMTFRDPSHLNRTIFCSWHGKIRTPLPYRIHFEWPVPKGQRRIKVTYIGPKITRQ